MTLQTGMRIEAKSVARSFGDEESRVEALKDFDLDISPGEFVSIVGPSGCGKSTFLEIVAGLLPLSSGEVTLDGAPINRPHPDVGVVFQQDSTFPWRTVIENVAFGLETRGVRRAERREKAGEALELVGLSAFAKRYPSQLSGGMRQRVALARTLVMDPKVILMDEPFGALDEQTRLIMGDELLKIWSKSGATVLFITHSIEESVMLSDRVVAMSARPGTIRKVVPVPLPRPRDTSLVGTPMFAEIKGEIWNIIREESTRTLADQT